MSNKQPLFPDKDHDTTRRAQATGEGKTAASGPAAHPLLNLQRKLGNAQVARMLAQRNAEIQRTGPDEDELQMMRDPSL